MNRPSPKPTALALACALCASPHAHAEVEDNPAFRQAYTDWASAHLALLPTSFLPGPFGTVADLATLGIDIRLRYLPASFVAPTPSPATPNADSLCSFRFTLPQREASYSNLLTLFDTRTLPVDWGPFGSPQVGHGNSEVKVSLDGPLLGNWSPTRRELSFPSGSHRIEWRADTQLDPLFDIAIPTVLFVINAELKYGKAITSTEPRSAARAFAIGKEFLLNAAIEAGVVAGGEISNLGIDAASHSQTRLLSVLDMRPPSISTSQPSPPPIEATRFGGEFWRDHSADLRATISASDPCNIAPLVGHNAPDFLPIGTTVVTWTARDTGALGPGNPGIASVQQNVVVQDTLAPILLAPPSRVIESNAPASPADVDLGTAVVFDLADANPALTSTAPGSFAPNSRTEVRWTATDGSGNSASKSQWVTVKTPGSNTPPSVQNVAASTLTSQPVDLLLQGSDGDLISGRFDPLSFRIVDPPANGFFVAPLLPYFIEDYRVRPDDEVGALLATSINPASDLYDTFCRDIPARPIPRDFVYDAEFVHVRNDDSAYVLDTGWFCQASNSDTERRIGLWNASGELVVETVAEFGPREVNRVTVDTQGGVQAVGPGTQSEGLILRRYLPDLSDFQSWQLRSTQPLNRRPAHISALYDAETGIIYATDKNYLFAYDGNDGQYSPAYIGALGGGQPFLSQVSSAAGNNTRGFIMELDSAGALYVPDPGDHRIYKFAPSSYDGTTFTPGALIGWMGRCDSGPNCDDENGRSFGYSCTDATCSVGVKSGALPGQFNVPLGIALDDKDMLYVTDYDNSRVQRFTPLGDFAGEAKSTCDGSCFVLGDMGRPEDISVNATSFRVLDRDRSLMHVFETAPFKDINESSVTVSYASDNGFQGTDQFRFRASDGLADSGLGTATVTVARNFRPPLAEDAQLSLSEDGSLAFTLMASDPDGIAGVDFNGLDTLSYEIVALPLHGTLSGSGATRTYTPNPDFHGLDALQFRVSDGRDVSEIATVDFEVLAINDPPVVRFTDATSKIVPRKLWPILEGKIAGSTSEAPRGFPLPLLVEFDDPDVGQAQFVQIAWGDGSVQSNNQTTPTDPNASPRPPIITTTFNGTGQVVGEHIYTTDGPHTLTVSVLDAAGAMGEVQAGINVVDMVDLTLDATPQDPEPAAPGSPVTLLFEIGSALPEGVPGIDATSVRFEGRLPPGVQLIAAIPEQGTCTHLGSLTQCAFGTLSPGASIGLQISMLPSGDFDPEAHPYLAELSSDQPDASGENLLNVELPVLPTRIFTDGFDD